MLKNSKKYSNDLRTLQSFANEVKENDRKMKRLSTMETKMVDDVIEENQKFKKTLDEIIKTYNIKIDLAQLQKERDKH